MRRIRDTLTIVGVLLIAALVSGQTFMGEVRVDAGLGEVAGTPPMAYTIPIVSQNVFVPIAATTTVADATTACFDSPSAGQLRYTCSRTASFHCGATLSSRGSLGAGDNFRAVCSHNGNEVPRSEANYVVRADNSSSATHCTVRMEQNDILTVEIANGTDTDNFTLDTFNLFCMRGM